MGEIASLKRNVILQNFTIMYICSTYIEYYDPFINSKVKTISSPKSKASKRTVPIPDYLQKKLKEYNIQLEHFTAHYFRHTFASRAIRNNISLETLKELLGHSNYEMISSIYAHSSQEDKIKAVRAVSNELQPQILQMELLSNENYQFG